MGKKLSNIEFIEKAKTIHGDRYDYSLSKYSGFGEKIKIICSKHGIFEQSPKRHVGQEQCGCKRCNSFNRIEFSEFLERSKKVHGEKYDYTKVNFKTTKKKVEIICSIHGSFYQTPEAHFIGRGCQKCGCFSRGENKIREVLNSNNIVFEEQKQFNNCKNQLPLRFDFYLPTKNILVEFDGRQHFKVSEIFGGKVEFERTKLRDSIKNEYALKHNIRLVRIPYVDYGKVEDIIKSLI